MLLLVLFVIVLCGHVTRSEDERPYTVEVDSLEIRKEYDQKYVNWDTLGLKKKGRNKIVVAGTFSVNRNLAAEQKINIQIFTYNKEKRIKGPILFNIEKNICKFVAEDERIYPGLLQKSNFPERSTCPIPKNEYTIDDYEINADFFPDDAPKGDFLIVFLLKDGLIPVAGVSAVITVEDA